MIAIISSLAVAAGLGFWWNSLPPPPDAWMSNVANNPDKFFLWGTTTHFDHAFTYAPHAADEWRLEYGTFPSFSLLPTNREKR